MKQLTIIFALMINHPAYSQCQIGGCAPHMTAQDREKSKQFEEEMARIRARLPNNFGCYPGVGDCPIPHYNRGEAGK